MNYQFLEEIMFAFLDTEDNVWLGDNDGPFLIESQETAKDVADILKERLQLSEGKVAIIVYNNSATKKRDEVDCKVSLEEAIEEINTKRMSVATGIPVVRLKKILSGNIIQSKKEDQAIRGYIGQ